MEAKRGYYHIYSSLSICRISSYEQDTDRANDSLLCEQDSCHVFVLYCFNKPMKKFIHQSDF